MAKKIIRVLIVNENAARWLSPPPPLPPHSGIVKLCKPRTNILSEMCSPANNGARVQGDSFSAPSFPRLILFVGCDGGAFSERIFGEFVVRKYSTIGPGGREIMKSR